MLLNEAGISDAIRVTGPITVFAPTDEAFEELSADTNAQLRSDPNCSRKCSGITSPKGCISPADLRTEPVRCSTVIELDVTTDGTTILVEGVPIVEADLTRRQRRRAHREPPAQPGELDLTGTGAPDGCPASVTTGRGEGW